MTLREQVVRAHVRLDAAGQVVRRLMVTLDATAARVVDHAAQLRELHARMDAAAAVPDEVLSSVTRRADALSARVTELEAAARKSAAMLENIERDVAMARAAIARKPRKPDTGTPLETREETPASVQDAEAPAGAGRNA